MVARDDIGRGVRAGKMAGQAEGETGCRMLVVCWVTSGWVVGKYVRRVFCN